MLSVSFTPTPNTTCRFAHTSFFIQPASTVRFRQPKPVTISSAYDSVSTGKEATSPISLNSSVLKLTHYEVLGISFGATRNDIKTAYRRLARINHPDVMPIDRKGSSAAEEFMKINDAYITLSDPDKRASYDRRLFINRSLSAGLYSQSQASLKMSRFSDYIHTRRNWETDQCW